MAKLLKRPVPGPWNDPDKNETALGKLLAQSDRVNVKKGNIEGLVLRNQDPFGAIGYTYYLVTRRKPLTLAYIPYGGGDKLPDSYIKYLDEEKIIEIEVGRRLGRVLYPEARK